MDCVFKAWGYVPQNKICIRCEPLENIFRSLGYQKERSSKAISLIFRTCTVLKADDILRDEKSTTKRFIATVVKNLYRLRLPKELNSIIKKADRTVKALEMKKSNVEDYIKQVSSLGGEVFRASTGDDAAFSVGKTLTAITTLHDMTIDLKKDSKTDRFNPLKTVSCEKIWEKFSSNIQIPVIDAIPSSVIRMYSIQTELTAQDCHHSIYTCLGVCGGICSAILLYRWCCQ